MPIGIEVLHLHNYSLRQYSFEILAEGLESWYTPISIAGLEKFVAYAGRQEFHQLEAVGVSKLEVA